MRILCVCNYGNIRSVALKNSFRMLNKKGRIDYDVLNVGLLCTSPETIKYLVEWADLVIDVADMDLIDERNMLIDFAGVKYNRQDIGGDNWHNPFDEELKRIVSIIRDKYRK